MPLSTTQYGYIIDPLVPLTDDTGRTISNGYVRIFVAGTSTPVITYKNFDGATNEETVQLDNSGRTAYPVIGSKGSTYKVCVYDAEHSQETPIKTIDKVVPTGASVSATNIVTGLDNVESPEAGWVKSTVSGTDAEVSLDATNVTSEVDTMVKATAASADYMMPLVHKAGSDPDKKITLGNIFKFVLNFIHSLTDTATEADLVSGNYLALDGVAGAKKLDSTTLLTKTAQNALAGNVAPAFDPTRDEDHKYLAGESVAYGGKVYVFNVDHYGAWNASHVTAINEDEATKNIGGCSCRLVGAGDTAVMTKIFVREGSFVRIVPRLTTWDTTGVVAPHVKFAVRRRTTAGSYVDFVSVAIANDVPSVIDVEIPTGTAWIEIFVRAAVGENLYFDAFSYTAIQEKSYPNITLFEMGNVAISSSSFIYSSSSTRARSKINTLIKVKKGDVFGVEAGFQMYVAFTQNGLSPYTTKGWTDTFTCPEDGFVAIDLRKGIGSDSPTTFEELMGNFYIRAFNSDLATIPYLVKTINSCGVSIQETYWGYNTNPVTKMFKIPSNVIFRLTLSRTTWEVANIGTYNRFIVRKVLLDDSTVDLFIASKTDIVPPVLDFVADSNVKAIEVLLRIDTGYSVDVQTQCIEQRGLMVHARDAAFRSVNHRGYNTIAPENTLPAFRLSAKMGFGIVETDVRLTSDGKFVCIHDATVNRTSNGSGNVADMTLDQLKALDFGSWKSAEYAGTKIPTYEEFLACCRNLGLKVYVEIKDVTGHYDELLAITRSYGMKDNTTFIADSGSKLVQINNRDTSYRVGYVISGITAERVATALSMFADNKNLFIDVESTNLNDSDVAMVEAAGIPLEVWTVNDIQTILGLNPYISGVTSDSAISSNFLYSAELGK